MKFSRKDKEFLKRLKGDILEIEPQAEIILYGSRARGDAREDSDWDILILLEGLINSTRIDKIYNKTFDIEIDTGYFLSTIINTNDNWTDPINKASPYFKFVSNEGLEI